MLLLGTLSAAVCLHLTRFTASAATATGPAPLSPDANPLAGLPVLPKTHFSWYRYEKRSDNWATLVDYARITHSVPIVHNANQSEIINAVNLCYHADGCGTTAGCSSAHNCSLAINWSPYVKTMEAAKTAHEPADPTKTTTLEENYLAEFSAWSANVTRWAAEASYNNGREVRIGAVIFDQEAFNNGADPNPDVRAALTAKNNAYYRAAEVSCPGAEIIQYNRGGFQVCPPGEPTCPAEYRNGVHGECTDPKLRRPAIPCSADGYFRDWPYTLDAEELGESFSVSLYQVPELQNMIAIFNRTANAAMSHGLSKVAPFICLGCGAKRNVRYPNGGSWVNTNEWDYDVSYSFLLGALVNEKLPWSGPLEPRRFGHWEMAFSPVFYPSIIDTAPEGPDDEASLLRAREIRLRHFSAYVRGASLDVTNPNFSANASACNTDKRAIENHRCVEALMPPPPPPPPPLSPTANPLAGLPELPKPHYSWYRYLSNRTYSKLGAADNHETLVDYARITHSMPVVHCGNVELGCPDTHAQVNFSVAICIEAGGNCTLSLDWSPYMDEAEHLGSRIDPRITTPLEQASLRIFENFLRNVTRWAAIASAAHPASGHNITVGAIGLDQEQVCGFCWSHSPDGLCNATTYHAITAKNNAYAIVATRELPKAEVIWYDRGGIHRCMPAALTCSSFDRYGVCVEKKESWMLDAPVPCDADGYRMNDCSTLALDEVGDSLSVSLYTVPEIARTVQEFNRTATNALIHNKNKVIPYICLGCGYQRDVLYPYGGSSLFSMTWDYDASYSYLLGAYMNAPQFHDQPSRYGLWSMARSAVFYPSIMDTEGDECTVRKHQNACCFVSAQATPKSILGRTRCR